MIERPGARGPAFCDRLLMILDKMSARDLAKRMVSPVNWINQMTNVAIMPIRK